LEQLRWPLFIIALICWVFIVGGELGSIGFLSVGNRAPGFGIPTMALLDLMILIALSLMAVSLIISGKLQGTIDSLTTLISAILILITCLVLIFKIIGSLFLMICLLFAPIFGTIAYFCVYADFPVGEAKAVLATLFFLKIAACVLLVFAQQRFLLNKKLVLILSFSLIANIIIGFLHGFVPGFLVSITDAVAGIVMVIFAVIWAIVFLIGGIQSTFRLLKR
jgi:hypothetical protein